MKRFFHVSFSGSNRGDRGKALLKNRFPLGFEEDLTAMEGCYIVKGLSVLGDSLKKRDCSP